MSISGPIAIALALVGAGVLLGAGAKAGPSSGGGSRIQARKATVDGRDYVIIKRGPTEFEVFSPEDPEAWLVFDANTGPLRQGARGADVDRDMRKFPPDLFG
jgi:hypothetical protein